MTAPSADGLKVGAIAGACELQSAVLSIRYSGKSPSRWPTRASLAQSIHVAERIEGLSVCRWRLLRGSADVLFSFAISRGLRYFVAELAQVSGPLLKFSLGLQALSYKGRQIE